MALTVFYLFNIILSKIKITDMEKEKNKIHINKFAEVKTKNIGSNTIISAFAFIDKEVVIENNCIIGEGVVIKNKVIVEDNCFIGPNTSIGLPAEWKNNENISLGVVIKSGTRITGHVTIDSGVLRQTMIGKNCYLMKHSHVGRLTYNLQISEKKDKKYTILTRVFNDNNELILDGTALIIKK